MDYIIYNVNFIKYIGGPEKGLLLSWLYCYSLLLWLDALIDHRRPAVLQIPN